MNLGDQMLTYSRDFDSAVSGAETEGLFGSQTQHVSGSVWTRCFNSPNCIAAANGGKVDGYWSIKQNIYLLQKFSQRKTVNQSGEDGIKYRAEGLEKPPKKE